MEKIIAANNIKVLGEDKAFKRQLGYVSQEDLLFFYGCYKQVTEGPCNVPKPSFYKEDHSADCGDDAVLTESIIVMKLFLNVLDVFVFTEIVAIVLKTQNFLFNTCLNSYNLQG